jgi:PAS domain-containing protein
MSTLLNAPSHALPSESAESNAVQRLLREHQTLLESADVGIVFIRQRVVVRCNRRYAEIFGYLHPQDMEGISSANFHPTRTEFRELGRTAYPTLSRGEVFKPNASCAARTGGFSGAHSPGA